MIFYSFHTPRVSNYLPEETLPSFRHHRYHVNAWTVIIMKMSPAMPVVLRFLRHQPCSHHLFSHHTSFTFLLSAKIQKFPDICKQTSGNLYLELNQGDCEPASFLFHHDFLSILDIHPLLSCFAIQFATIEVVVYTSYICHITSYIWYARWLGVIICQRYNTIKILPYR